MDLINEANSAPTMLERAKALWELGFHIFPLGSPADEFTEKLIQRFGSEEEARKQWPKTPRISWAGYQARPPTEEEVERWWTQWPNANIAIVTGIQFDAIDADSDEAVEWCRNNLTRTPWENHTGRGVQFLFRKTDLDIRNSANPNSKIDTRGKGGYIVAPGSTHGNGTVYQLVVDEAWGIEDPADLPALTPEDMAAIRGFKAPANSFEAGQLCIDASTVSVDPLTTDPVVKGGRNNKAAQLAGKWINDGWDLQAVRRMLVEWNQGNQPPLKEEELERTLLSVARTHQRNNPDRPVKLAPPPIAQNTKADDSGGIGIPITYVSGLMDKPPEKPEPIWGGPTFFRGCRMMIVGQPKAGKSRWSIAFGSALATGGEFLGEIVQRPLRVLWLNAEIHEAWLPDRFKPIIKNTPPDLLPLLREHFVMTGRIRLDVMHPIHFELLRSLISHHRIDVVIVDPMINFSSVNENDNTEIRALLDAFDALQAETNTSIILVHHSRKGNIKGESNPFDTIRGASALRGWYDTGVVLAPTKTPGEVNVAWELRNGEQRPAHNAVWNDARGCYEVMKFSMSETVVSKEDAEPLSAVQERATKIYEWITGRFVMHGEEPNAPGDEHLSASLKQRFSGYLGCSERTAQRAMELVADFPNIERRDLSDNRYILAWSPEE